MPSVFNTTPDYRRLLTVLKGEVPDRLPVYEFFSDTGIQFAALGDWSPGERLPAGDIGWLNDHIRAQYGLGYDYVSISIPFGFPSFATKTLTDARGFAHDYVDEVNVTIRTREDMARQTWPTADSVDFSDLEYLAGHLPDGMRIVANLGGGLLEWGMWLMGAEPFCLAIYDDPGFVQELLQRINNQQVAVAGLAASHPEVMAVAIGDDMGFKTQTFLPPKALREFIFPGLRRIADAVHAHGKPFILHSCGNLYAVMDDLIETVTVDAKHSFEEAANPVAEVKARWGDRLALLGGIDLDMLCRAPEDHLRAYVRRTIEACAPGGGWALGSGNSIPNYIPPRSLYVMLEEGLCGG